MGSLARANPCIARGRRKRGRESFLVYDLTYAYDAGGNRLAKTDSVNARRVDYHYDLYDQENPPPDPHPYESDNNRLMYYETFDTTGGPGADVLLSTTWYYYGENGNPTRIVTADADSPDHYEATRFGYARNGQAVTYILGEQWDDANPDPAVYDIVNYEVTYAREFRYDGARQRYLNRALDPATVMTGDFTAPPLSEVWSDYDGDNIYGDFTITGSPGAFVNARSFQPGVATVDPWSASGSSDTDYFHTNHLGTTRSMSDDGGVPNDRVVYTAFGERISGDNHRYGYAGAYGYQSHDFPDGDPIPYSHVGARYYDPAAGRFLQRDPIGILGGFNVYAYAGNMPTVRVDPDGLFWGVVIKGIVKGGKWIIKKLAKKKPKPKAKPKPSPKFKKPTNPPQHPPKDLPPGTRVRTGKPTEQYPDGYWRMEKLQKDGKWQYVDPSTMKPGPACTTHVPLPPRG